MLCSMNVNNTGLIAPFLTTSALKNAYKNDSCFLVLEELNAAASVCPAATVQPHSWSSTARRDTQRGPGTDGALPAYPTSLPHAHHSVPAMETPASQSKTGSASRKLVARCENNNGVLLLTFLPLLVSTRRSFVSDANHLLWCSGRRRKDDMAHYAVCGRLKGDIQRKTKKQMESPTVC